MIVLVLLIIALVCAGVALFQSRGQSLVAWSALLISIALLLPKVG